MGRACDSTASSAFATLICDVATLEPEGVKLFTPRDTVPQGFKVSDDGGVGDQRREAEVLVGGERGFGGTKAETSPFAAGFVLKLTVCATCAARVRMPGGSPRDERRAERTNRAAPDRSPV